VKRINIIIHYWNGTCHRTWNGTWHHIWPKTVRKESFEEDYAHFSRLPNESQMNSILQKAGQEFAIQKGGSTNRMADGRKRK
jgi:hypothetical protein